MPQSVYEKFLAALDELVRAEGTYTEKRAALVAAATRETDKANLDEYDSWCVEDYV